MSTLKHTHRFRNRRTKGRLQINCPSHVLPQPIITIHKIKFSATRYVFQCVTSLALTPRQPVQPDRRLCRDTKCVNPFHQLLWTRRFGAPGQMVEPDPDQEIVELLDIIKSVHKERFSSVESLRERVGTEFTLEDYKDALRLDEAVRARLIEV